LKSKTLDYLSRETDKNARREADENLMISWT
jgi:hypothetical protein